MNPGMSDFREFVISAWKVSFGSGSARSGAMAYTEARHSS